MTEQTKQHIKAPQHMMVLLGENPDERSDTFIFFPFRIPIMVSSWKMEEQIAIEQMLYEDLLKHLEEEHRSRMLAGYCV